MEHFERYLSRPPLRQVVHNVDARSYDLMFFPRQYHGTMPSIQLCAYLPSVQDMQAYTLSSRCERGARLQTDCRYPETTIPSAEFCYVCWFHTRNQQTDYICFFPYF